MSKADKKDNILPDKKGHFGIFGGRYVPETLMPLINEVSLAWQQASEDKEFLKDFSHYLSHYVGRPSALYFAQNLSRKISDGTSKIYLKREDLNHTGAHKINNCLGQVLLAKRMGKTRIIAETGAGQHGVAVATVCALFNLRCVIYMGKKDIVRQSPNVFRMKLLGAQVRSVDSGTQTLKDALNEALRDWASNVYDTYYIIGTVAGPHPYPQMGRDLQSVIGREAREQFLSMNDRLPDYLLACVGGGSNAIGLFHPFIDDIDVKMIGVEAAGKGLDSGHHAASMKGGRIGVLHGSRSYILQDKEGQIQETHSISAGLDYPGVGPELAFLFECGRIKAVAVNDDEAVEGFHLLSQTEGIIPALECAHCIAYLKHNIDEFVDKTVIVNLSGRGDKDIFTIAKLEDIELL